MKPISKKLLTIILAFMVLSLFVGEVRADDDKSDDSLIVSIESADYLDLDEDQIEDDIIIEFTIEIPRGDWDFHHTFVYCELTLPSGYYFQGLILISGTYSSLSITLGWYDTAIESGWYTIDIWACGLGPDAPDLGHDSLIFDPPTDGNPSSPPLIEIIEIIAE